MITEELLETIRKNNDPTLTSLEYSKEDGLTKKEILFLIEALKTNKTVTHIKFFNVGIDLEGAIAFSELLKVNRTIEHVNLQANSIGLKGFKVITDVLNDNNQLKHLNCVNSEIQGDGYVIIEAANSMLQKLTTWNDCKRSQTDHLYLLHQLHSRMGILKYMILAEEEKRYINLDNDRKFIDIDGLNRIYEKCKSYKSTSTILSDDLLIGYDKKYDQEMDIITKRLEQDDKTLSHLDLSYTVQSDDNLYKVAKALKTNKTLMHLDLCMTFFSYKGMTAIIDTLKKNTTFVSINFDEDQLVYFDVEKTKGLLNLLQENFNIIISYQNIDYSPPFSSLVKQLIKQSQRNKDDALDTLEYLEEWQGRDKHLERDEEYIALYERLHPRLSLVRFLAQDQYYRKQYGVIDVDAIYLECQQRYELANKNSESLSDDKSKTNLSQDESQQDRKEIKNASIAGIFMGMGSFLFACYRKLTTTGIIPRIDRNVLDKLIFKKSIAANKLISAKADNQHQSPHQALSVRENNKLPSISQISKTTAVSGRFAGSNGRLFRRSTLIRGVAGTFIAVYNMKHMLPQTHQSKTLNTERTERGKSKENQNIR